MQGLMLGLARLVTNTFFRRIDVLGRDHVPADGPVIFAGNHPNALMDGWLLAAHCGRAPLRFLAHAKLWEYPILGWLMDHSGAVPVNPRTERDVDADHSAAFERLYAVLGAGECIGIFPEGVSHVDSQLATLKTGTARIALEFAARHRVNVCIVPCGLNYLHRHRFRSQVLLDFGAPLDVGEAWVARYAQDPAAAVRQLTGTIADALSEVTVNAPDWNTMRFAHIARRLYKPSAARLTPAQYVELNRRFLQGYLDAPEDPELRAFRDRAEDYQARLEILGIKDHQLRKPLSTGVVARRLGARSLMMMLLLPLAIPAALIHLPVGWMAAAVGTRFSYEQDDEATLKVLAALALLPILYFAIVVLVAWGAGGGWALLAALVLVVSTLASMRLLEAEASLVLSTLSLLRIVRLEHEIADLRALRGQLVEQVRDIVDRRTPVGMDRIFKRGDFAGGARDDGT